MSQEQPQASATHSAWLIPALLAVGVFLMYGSSLTTDYLMNDEMYHVGRKIHAWHEVRFQFFSYGRALWGLFTWLVYTFVGYDTLRIQLVRFTSLASFAVMAVVLFRFLQARSRNTPLAFFTVLFFLSLPSFQGISGYSLGVIAGSVPASWLSLGAFFLYFSARPRRTTEELVALGAVFVLIVAAMQATQTYAFLAVVPLSFAILTGAVEDRRRAVKFLAVAIASFLVSSLVFKLGVDHWIRSGHQPYPLGAEGLDALATSPFQVALTAINPVTYWSAFRVWSYPYPFHSTLPLDEVVKRAMALGIMTFWIVLVGAAILTELRAGDRTARRGIAAKWLLVAVCLGFGAVFILADSPLEAINHRPHIVMTFAGVCAFTGAYALMVLAGSYRIVASPVVKGLGIAVVIMLTLGAQTSFVRGVVGPRAQELEFIRTELGRRPSKGYTQVLVVLPRPALVCVTEPCDPWFGSSPHSGLHHARKGRYRYALSTLGVPPDSKEIVFADRFPDQVPRSTLVINWKRYVDAKRRQLATLRKQRAGRPPG